jgi:hypothetical protein
MLHFESGDWRREGLLRLNVYGSENPAIATGTVVMATTDSDGLPNEREFVGPVAELGRETDER